MASPPIEPSPSLTSVTATSEGCAEVEASPLNFSLFDNLSQKTKLDNCDEERNDLSAELSPKSSTLGTSPTNIKNAGTSLMNMKNAGTSPTNTKQKDPPRVVRVAISESSPGKATVVRADIPITMHKKKLVN